MQRRSQLQTPVPRVPRRTLGLLLALFGLVFSLVGMVAGPAAAQAVDADALAPCPDNVDTVGAGDSVVHIVKVAGLLDPVVHDHLLSRLDRAESTDGVIGFVIWLDSEGSVLNDADFVELATRLDESPVPVAIWVGQSGAAARGGAAVLLGVADLVGVSAGSTIGETGPARLPDSFGPAFGEATERLETATITADEAVQLGISVGPLQDVAAIGPFLTNLDGYEILQCRDEALAAVGDGDTPQAGIRTIPVTVNELTGLPLTSQLFHTVASPEVAYLFFVMGIGLLVFELFTAGVGVAGLIGAGFCALGCYGLAVLPTRWWGIALLVGAVVAIAVDVQTNVPRFYSALGVGLFVLGTFLLYDGIRMSWVTMIAGIIGALLYTYTGMPSMVRTRFSTPTIGRKWMIGEMGEAITDVSPEGTVQIRDVAWRAITNRATPVKAGDPVRVVGLDRLLLEVEPEEGGAKDYRNRS
ncbi:MAG: NfeD family protein [Actinomycetota bacterium]